MKITKSKSYYDSFGSNSKEKDLWVLDQYLPIFLRLTEVNNKFYNKYTLI